MLKIHSEPRSSAGVISLSILLVRLQLLVAVTIALLNQFLLDIFLGLGKHTDAELKVDLAPVFKVCL